MDHVDVREIAEINKDLHKIVARELSKRKPVVLALRKCKYECDEDSLKILRTSVHKYPHDVYDFYVMDLILMTNDNSKELLKVLKAAGINILGIILDSRTYQRYRRDQSNYLKNIGLYKEDEVDKLDEMYIRNLAKKERKPIDAIRKKFDYLDL